MLCLKHLSSHLINHVPNHTNVCHQVSCNNYPLPKWHLTVLKTKTVHVRLDKQSVPSSLINTLLCSCPLLLYTFVTCQSVVFSCLSARAMTTLPSVASLSLRWLLFALLYHSCLVCISSDSQSVFCLSTAFVQSRSFM